MQNTMKASQAGKTKIKEARENKGWTIDDPKWLEEASKVRDPNWQGGEYLAEGISWGTWSRFLAAKRPINTPAFRAYCQVLGLHWEDISEQKQTQTSNINQTSEATWLLILSATLKEVDKPKAEAIVAHLRQFLEDTQLTLQRIEEGSVVLVLKGSQEAFEVMEALFQSSQLTHLLGIPVENVCVDLAISIPVNLSQWLQNNFTEAIQAGWQTLQEIFGTTTLTPAFRSNAVKRAKQILLPDDRALALILDLKPAENQEISTNLGVYPIGNQTYLPENLKLTVYESGEILAEVSAPSQSEGMLQPLFFLPGENFTVELLMGDFIYREDFEI